MRIGIDARFWYETGVGRYIRNLVSGLEKLDTGHSFVLFVKEDQAGEIRKQVSGSKFTVVGTSIHWHSVREQVLFPQVINKEDLDLMHFTYFSVPILYRGKFVVTIHDLIIHHFATGEATTLPFPMYRMKVKGYKYVISKAAKNAKKIIAVSEATKKEAVDHLGVQPEKVVVTYEGVDPLIAKNQEPRAKNNYGKYFLHVGNVYPHKNTKRLIDALDLINDSEFKLIFVGKKDYFMSELENYVRSKDIKNVEFLGFVKDKDLGELYRHAVATVVPSLMEGFGLPVLEAMANGSLVLASDTPSLREVGQDACIYFDPLKISSLSAKMQQIMFGNLADFESNKKRGLQIVQKFSWDKMAIATLKIYESCF